VVTTMAMKIGARVVASGEWIDLNIGTPSEPVWPRGYNVRSR
jgi:hypothetical protein